MFFILQVVSVLPTVLSRWQQFLPASTVREISLDILNAYRSSQPNINIPNIHQLCIGDTYSVFIQCWPHPKTPLFSLDVSNVRNIRTAAVNRINFLMVFYRLSQKAVLGSYEVKVKINVLSTESQSYSWIMR
jgi:hypothetical protein